MKEIHYAPNNVKLYGEYAMQKPQINVFVRSP